MQKQKSLVILDLNGIFVDRVHTSSWLTSEEHSHSSISIETAHKLGNFHVWVRPGTEQFLDFLFRNFNVAVWSSVTSYNIDALVGLVFKERAKDLLFVWNQSHCVVAEAKASASTQSDSNDKQGSHMALSAKVPYVKLTYLKNLNLVWEKYPNYNQTNTLIIDDNVEKMANNDMQNYIIAKKWQKEYIRSEEANGELLFSREKIGAIMVPLVHHLLTRV